MTDRTDPRPYRLDGYPTSRGRLFLARAFEHLLCLEHGIAGPEIEEALDGAENQVVESAVARLGATFAEGAIATFARRFGGGDPIELPSGHWEIDDFRRRFATSAIDPDDWSNPNAEPTHWLFVARDPMNQLFEAVAMEHVAARLTSPAIVLQAETADIPAAVRMERVAATPAMAPVNRDEDGWLGLDEVTRLSSLSRSTIYRRMRAGRFPGAIELDGNLARWRRIDVLEWLRAPT